MNNNLKRTLAAVMAVAVILCAAPLNGFLGIDLPDWLSFGEIEAHAVTEFTSGIYTYTLAITNTLLHSLLSHGQKKEQYKITNKSKQHL